MILYHSLSTSSAHTTMASLASSPIRYSFIRAIPAVFCRNPSKPFLSPSKVPLVRSNLINFTQRILNYRNYSAVTRASNTESPPGLYSSKKFDLTVENVDLVLEDVRPYLIADGGNVDVVSVDDGVISLKLQGACGSCPSSTTTMTMGIERVLKEKFGNAVKHIRQVDNDQKDGTTVEAINSHLDILRPAIKNYGGSVEVLSLEGGDCLVKYVGPETIGSGIKAAIKERFPDVVNVVFTG